MIGRVYFYPCECPLLSASPGPHSVRDADGFLAQASSLIEPGKFRKIRLSFVDGERDIFCKFDLSAEGYTIKEVINQAINELDDTP